MEKIAHDTTSKKQERSESTRETIRFAITALATILIIRTFVASPFIVEGASMDATFHDNDYLIVDKLSYRFNEPQRGDIIVFRYPNNPSVHHIKRIIGIPGDIVTVRDSTVSITNTTYPNGIVLNEPYLIVSNNQIPYADSRTLGEHEYYVMGDNRDASLDSRRYGQLEETFISGRVIARLFPFNTMRIFPGFSGEDAMMIIKE